jgi:hypothetical protein
LAADGDSAVLAFLIVPGRTVAWRIHITRMFMVLRKTGRSGDSNGQESSDDKLNKIMKLNFTAKKIKFIIFIYQLHVDSID